MIFYDSATRPARLQPRAISALWRCRTLTSEDRTIEYIVGFTLALFFFAAAAGLGMDRERVFYPAVVMAVASDHVAFAVGDGSGEVMAYESAIAAVFIAGAVLALKRSSWMALVGLVMLVRARASRGPQSFNLR